jgi:hypothetical protein
MFEGVWLSQEPLDANEGANGDTVLRVTFKGRLPSLDYWEWVEDKTYREWLVPAELINKNATTRLDSGRTRIHKRFALTGEDAKKTAAKKSGKPPPVKPPRRLGP